MPRFYGGLPRVGNRVRSSSSASASSRALSLSALSFFDGPQAPPPPNTRLATHRLPIEARAELEGPNGSTGNTSHAPLALAAPHSPSTHSPHPAQLALLFPYTPGPQCSKSTPAQTSSGARAHRRRGPKYTLEVGAYGIPKRGHRVRSLHTHTTDAPLAVQVGEDAYFVRDNAMGVADGVGGWARVKHAVPPSSPSASALFARRLMHFCADEVDRASHLDSHPHSHAHQYPHPPPTAPRPIVTPWRPPSSPSRFAPYPLSNSHAGPSSLPSWASSPLSDFFPSSSAFPSSYASTSSSHASQYDPYDPYISYEHEDLYVPDDYDSYDSPADLLAAELDELADGLDVLNILERAYERTLSAHVVPVAGTSTPPTSLSAPTVASTVVENATKPSPSTAAAAPAPTAASVTGKPAATTTKPAWPFTRDQLPAQTKAKEEPKTIPLLAGSSTALVAVLDYVWLPEDATCASANTNIASPPTTSNGAAGKADANTDTAAPLTLTPVLKIAHVGDCMGMLVRDGEVAWRSEEMWWRWNTPVQLSAAPSGGAAAAKTEEGAGMGKAGWWRYAASSASALSTPSASTAAEVTPSSAAHLFTLPVRAGDIVILASDGLSDNLWDEDVLEEVARVGRVFAVASGSGSGSSSGEGELQLEEVGGKSESEGGIDGAVFAGKECRDAEGARGKGAEEEKGWRACSAPASCASSLPDVREEPARGEEEWTEEDDTPFARRARETGRVYRGGKNDDISVIVAVIAPAEEEQHIRLHDRGRGRMEAARAA
ncbi:Protein phosphatase [Mycena sanguinolenta]|uniref:Protein phosphatase n=1 Tax=Mycena sanguinolenta TaxID=230812 RepID=A0A8H6YTE5_9AGAR|nr:Protein phosphatase [Mycena sanguinolenta]